MRGGRSCRTSTRPATTRLEQSGGKDHQQPASRSPASLTGSRRTEAAAPAARRRTASQTRPFDSAGHRGGAGTPGTASGITQAGPRAAADQPSPAAARHVNAVRHRARGRLRQSREPRHRRSPPLAARRQTRNDPRPGRDHYPRVEKGETVRWQPVSPTLIAGAHRNAPLSRAMRPTRRSSLTKAPSQSIPDHRGRRGYPVPPSLRVCESLRCARQQTHHPPASSVFSSGSKPTSMTGIASRSSAPKTAIINLRSSLADRYGPPLVRGPDRLTFPLDRGPDRFTFLVWVIPHQGNRRSNWARYRTKQQRRGCAGSRERAAARILVPP